MFDPVWVAFATGIAIGMVIAVVVMAALGISKCSECVGSKLWGEEE